MNADIREIKVWTRATDVRVYVTTQDRRQGCLYLRGNRWHPAGSREGRLTDEEWQAAEAISFARSGSVGKWCSVREWELSPAAASHPAATQPAPATPRNRRPQACSACGEMVPAGEGYLHRFTDEEDRDRFGGGWHVYHVDEALCARNRELRQARAAEAQAAEAAKKAERLALAERVAKGTGLPLTADWSFDDYRFRRGAVLAESEHWRAFEYFEGDRLIGFTVREKRS